MKKIIIVIIICLFAVFSNKASAQCDLEPGCIISLMCIQDFLNEIDGIETPQRPLNVLATIEPGNRLELTLDSLVIIMMTSCKKPDQKIICSVQETLGAWFYVWRDEERIDRCSFVEKYNFLLNEIEIAVLKNKDLIQWRCL